MHIRTISSGEVESLQVPLLVVPFYGGAGQPQFPQITPEVDDVVTRLAAVGAVTAGSRVTTLTASTAGPAQVALIGLGDAADTSSPEVARRFAAHAVRLAEDLRVTELAIVLPQSRAGTVASVAKGVAEGAVLAAWRFTELKAPDDSRPAPVSQLHIVLPQAEVEVARDAVAIGAVLAEFENRARDLQSRPGNVATPTHLAEEARRLAADEGLEVEILGPGELAAQKMGALLAVSAGSEEEPRLIILRHQGGKAGDKPLVLVGKGLTFDAGGISIKPAEKMEEMKFDMSGGAAVIAAMGAIARLGLPRNVVGIVPSSENLLSGRAVKPGDVITTRAGKTVEVINTDAEGRLILSDALDYAVELEPEAMVDCATLTGAVVIGLGHHAMAVLGTDDRLVEELRAAGEVSGERAWPLPLWPEYRKQLDSTTADLKNIGGRPGGTITAAAFLREFVGDVPWAHLDIAGTAYGDATDLPYRRVGGYGVPTRLLIEWVRSRA
jgi:leucyl aminopeptidase